MVPNVIYEMANISPWLYHTLFRTRLEANLFGSEQACIFPLTSITSLGAQFNRSAMTYSTSALHYMLASVSLRSFPRLSSGLGKISSWLGKTILSGFNSGTEFVGIVVRITPFGFKPPRLAQFCGLGAHTG